MTRVVLIVLCALQVTMQLYVWIPIHDTVSASYGGQDMTPALSAALFGYAAGFLLFGPVTDRFGRRRVLLAGVAVMAVLTFLVPFAPTPVLSGLLRVIQGFAGGAFSPSALSYLGEALPRRAATTAIGAVSTAYLMAGVLGQVMASVITQAWGWQWLFWLSAAGLAVNVALLALVMHEERAGDPSARVVSGFAAQARLLARADIAVPLAAVFVLMLSFVAMYTSLATELVDALHLPESMGTTIRLAGVPGMLVAPFVGSWVGRVGTETGALVGYLLAAAGLAIEALGAGSVPIIIAGSNIFVAGIAVASTAMVTMFGDRAAPRRGAGTALYGFTVFLGASSAPYLAHALGFRPLLGILVAALIGGAALVASSRRASGPVKPVVDISTQSSPLP
ncbi:MFS transporter [Mycobacteroides abscessus]|uniref:Major facilitator transporter n=1 Tax=Mycobacteroides abscessus subsp. bolletii TaxID=319705 RepID=A0A9Q7SGB4_9MYCO|nr:MFS transporter [Mycobacteroides abscessus]MBN7495129.1 MFS transporter [Mycobacteroides abscessus subsp. abscessus]MDM2080982.1 MFS transporter [Mycobacteroides abscessus]MDM2085274.1 MFS transporter [Mycobacteroides abscessus]MDM3902204.1 MFS transporter [Mycobacteroides abscessus]MDO3068376.1 MFS transporter [Mycobacteroides abscessus subsp. bolletii]